MSRAEMAGFVASAQILKTFREPQSIRTISSLTRPSLGLRGDRVVSRRRNGTTIPPPRASRSPRIHFAIIRVPHEKSGLARSWLR
jgi:hypothetical protein